MPAGVVRDHALGRLRDPGRAALRPLCREPAGRDGAPMPGPRKPGPELSGGESCWREPQWSAERRAPFARGASAARRDRYAPFGALLPSPWEQRKERRSRRLKKYGGVALAKAF